MEDQEPGISQERQGAAPPAPEAQTEPFTASAAESANADVGVPEFAEVSDRVVKRFEMNPDRLQGVSVPVWAELGRVEMQIGNLLQLGEGSVVTLDRAVGDPVDLVSQGVKLARGEVIVVNDCFAIRIREILSGK